MARKGVDARGLRGRYALVPPGIRYMAAGAFFFSLMSLFVKVAGQRIPNQEIVLARAIITFAISWWAVRRAGLSPAGRNRPGLIARGVVGYIALSAFYYAVVHLPLADATVIQYTNPIFAALIAVPLLGERIDRREFGSVAVAMAGVLLVTRPAFIFGGGAAGLDPVAVAIGMVGAIGSGAAYVMVRRLRATEDPMVIVLFFAGVSVVASLPFAAADFVLPTGVEALALVGVGITAQLGQVAITRGLHLERAGRATGVGYLQIVFAGLWGMMFFGELPTIATFAGAVLIVGATLALARESRAEGRPDAV